MFKRSISKRFSLKVIFGLLVLTAPLIVCAQTPEQAGFFSRLWSNITGFFNSSSSASSDSTEVLVQESVTGELESEAPSGDLQAAKPISYAHQDNCLFCQIYAGDKPATIYDKNENAMVIRSLSGGILAIPRSHIPSLKELREDNKEHLVNTLLYAAHVARTNTEFSKKFYHAAYFHTGTRAYQTQFHIHMHMKFLNLMPAVYDIDRVFDAQQAQILAENDVARVYLLKERGAENNHTRSSARVRDPNADTQLRVCFKKPVSHLDKLDGSDPTRDHTYASRIVDGILLATQTIARLYPDCDYVTEITNAVSASMGGQTLDIRITLK